MAEQEPKQSTQKIEALTPEQDRLLDVYHDRYLAMGMDPTPTDKPRVEKAIKALYAREGLKEPEIRWYPSPLSMTRAAREAGVQDLFTGWDGQYDAGFFGNYMYYREVLGMVKETEDLMIPIEFLYGHSGPMIECENVVFVSENFTHIFTDDNGELHCESGPAFLYGGDNFCGYYWHGFEVPDWIVLKPQDITVEKIHAEENAEIRRIMLERFGTGRFVAESGGVVLDEDKDDLNGARMLVKDKLGNVLLHVGDPSTGRMYWLDVPPDTKTCVEANDFLSGSSMPREKQIGRS